MEWIFDDANQVLVLVVGLCFVQLVKTITNDCSYKWFPIFTDTFVNCSDLILNFLVLARVNFEDATCALNTQSNMQVGSKSILGVLLPRSMLALAENLKERRILAVDLDNSQIHICSAIVHQALDHRMAEQRFTQAFEDGFVGGQ